MTLFAERAGSLNVLERVMSPENVLPPCKKFSLPNRSKRKCSNMSNRVQNVFIWCFNFQNVSNSQSISLINVLHANNKNINQTRELFTCLSKCYLALFSY